MYLLDCKAPESRCAYNFLSNYYKACGLPYKLALKKAKFMLKIPDDAHDDLTLGDFRPIFILDCWYKQNEKIDDLEL